MVVEFLLNINFKYNFKKKNNEIFLIYFLIFKKYIKKNNLFFNN